MTADLISRGARILQTNDRGGYTVPTARLYPFQWNWDSGFVSLGFATFDAARAWQELDKLVAGQWADGLIPHIIFHQSSPDYFPGPGVWGLENNPLPTSGISQPPVLASMVLRLLEGDADRAAAEGRARALYPKLLAYHRWWWRARDPQNTGLVAIVHPWESGMDNSPAWDAALARVPETQNKNYVRRDTSHVDSAQRPRQSEYDRYLHMVELYRSGGYDPAFIWEKAPFKAADLCCNAALQRATEDLLVLARSFGTADEITEIEARIALGRHGWQSLWDGERGYFFNKDLLTGDLIPIAISASFLGLYAGVADGAQAARLAAHLADWGRQVRYLVPSTDPGDATFERQRYWRGPVWLVVNWMVADGLARYGFADLAERVRTDSRALVEDHDFFEYFDPTDGTGYGGGDFSWTSAMYLAWAGR